MGRSGREKEEACRCPWCRLEANNYPPNSCEIVATVESWNIMILQIENEKNNNARKERMREFKDVLSLFILPKQCIHQELEKSFEKPRSNDTYRLPPCENKCWYCSGQLWIRPESGEVLKSAINTFFMTKQEPVRTADFSRLLFKDYSKNLWPKNYLKKLRQEAKANKRRLDTSETALRQSNQCLVLALLLEGVLGYSVITNDDDKKSKEIRVHIKTTKSNDRIYAPWGCSEWDNQMKRIFNLS